MPTVTRASLRPPLIVERRVGGVILLNAVAAVALLWWLVPSPWGGLVPVLLLAQWAWWRHGTFTTVAALVVGSASGALVGRALGLGDVRRAALALLLVVLPAVAAWPRASSARR